MLPCSLPLQGAASQPLLCTRQPAPHPTLPLPRRHLDSSPCQSPLCTLLLASCSYVLIRTVLCSVFPRHLARAQKRKAAKLAAAAGEAGGEDNVDAERAAAIEAEFQRAKERLTLRHRNSSRWARRALKRGQLNMDTGGRVVWLYHLDCNIKTG